MATRRPPSNTKIVWILLGVIGGLGLLGLCVCGGLAYWLVTQGWALGLDQPTPGLELQQADYAEARGRFKTHLLRQGPSPQKSQPVDPAPDAREVTFPSGSLQLKAWINEPPAGDQGKKPAVLFLHNGLAFGEEDWDQAAPFRQAGFVTMTPMLRGENGQPGSFSMFYDEVDDVLAAADFLAKQPYVDASRIYLAGHSSGGILTLLAAMTSPRFRAAASFSGEPDMISLVDEQPDQVPFDRSNIAELQMRSAVAYATSFKCPVRLYFGDREFFLRAPCQRTAKLAKGSGLDVEAVEVPGDHMTSAVPAMRQAIAFFQQDGGR
jgi:dienelactone hydrolase